MAASSIGIAALLLNAAQLPLTGLAPSFATHVVYVNQHTVRLGLMEGAMRVASADPNAPMQMTYIVAPDPTMNRLRLSSENETDSVQTLAAAIAFAQSPREIVALMFDAQQAGLNDDQIAFSFGMARALNPSSNHIEAAFSIFQLSVYSDAMSAADTSQPLNEAFESGLQAIAAPPSENAVAPVSANLSDRPFGAVGFQGGSPGGGGASPR